MSWQAERKNSVRYLALIFAFGYATLLLTSRALAADSAAMLADAAERQDWNAARHLLAEHTDVNAAQADGMTALHWATYHDNADAVRSMVEAEADVKATNRYGVTPLSIACTNGNAEIVKRLLQTGADPNARLRGGETALMTAARTGVPAVVEELIDRGADVNAKEQNGQTALMWAAAEGHAEVVDALLNAGADFRTPLDSGFTPLLFAVREGRIEVVRALLKAGADVNEAVRPKKRADRGPEKGVSPLIMAVENGHFELAVALLKAGADPNDQRSGYTPLHTLTWVRKPNSGDDPDGQAPPAGSGKLTSLEFARLLVEHGADVNARLKHGDSGEAKLNRTGATPFLMAADTADAPLMRLLVQLGADPSMRNADNCTPLMAAAGIGTIFPQEEAGTEDEVLEAVQLAAELGGDVNAVDDNGETAMHGAAYKSAPKVVQWLADHGAREEIWNRKNKYGWTPLLIAQGYRKGNFKPDVATIEAIRRVMSKEALAEADAAPPPADPSNNYGAPAAKTIQPGDEMPSRADYPAHWWAPVSIDGVPEWEILPQAAGSGEVILSKRNELGLLSNFAATPFMFHDQRYASLEGFWQSLLYPEGDDDPRAKHPGLKWEFTRDEVAQMVAFEAKHAGDLGKANMKKMGIDWVTFEGRRMEYRPKEPGEHYRLIVEATKEKVRQNPEVQKVLLATGELKLKPDHLQGDNPPAAWRYYEILTEIRTELQLAARRAGKSHDGQ
jgi:ankyrin repeat protein